MNLTVLVSIFLSCCISQGYAHSNAEEIRHILENTCDASQIEVPSHYNCDIAEPEDVTLADVSFATWHEGPDRYFRIEERKQCYTEANRTCERLGGTLVNLDSTALAWMANNLGNDWYSLWTSYRAIDKGTLTGSARKCVFEPSIGQEPVINLVMYECLFCECLSTLIVVQDGVVLQKLNRQSQCNIPLSVLCEQPYD